jgi:hypothetical protein
VVSREATAEMLFAFEADVVLLHGHGLVLRDCVPIESNLLRHCMPKRSQVDFIFHAFPCRKSQFSAEGLVQEGLFQRRQRRELLLVDPRQPLGFGGKVVELAFREGASVLEVLGGVGLGGGQTPERHFDGVDAVLDTASLDDTPARRLHGRIDQFCSGLGFVHGVLG